MKKVIGVVGPIGAGKDTVSDYIARKHGYRIVSFRDIVKEETVAAGLEPNRENMQKIGAGYREKYEKDYWAKKVLEKAKMYDKVIIKEMRTLQDVDVQKKHFGDDMLVIFVDAEEKTRFGRMKARGRPGDPKTMEEFGKQEAREEELHFTDSFRLADVKIDNNGTLEELYRKVDKFMR